MYMCVCVCVCVSVREREINCMSPPFFTLRKIPPISFYRRLGSLVDKKQLKMWNV